MCATLDSAASLQVGSAYRQHPARAHPALDAVQHLGLTGHQDAHVQEDLVQVHQAALQLGHLAVTLLNLADHLQRELRASQAPQLPG